MPIDTPRCDLTTDSGPFDIVGDVHGCSDELDELLQRLGYVRDGTGLWGHPGARTVVFLGDLVDRGPRIADTLRTAMRMVEAGRALCVTGNHELKLRRKLAGFDIPVAHGLDRSLAELDDGTRQFPVPFAWVAGYAGGAAVVYGHTPVREPLWVNRTINIDTGCVLGHRLTALRWPEEELVAVAARRQYSMPSRPLRDERRRSIPD